MMMIMFATHLTQAMTSRRRVDSRGETNRFMRGKMMGQLFRIMLVERGGQGGDGKDYSEDKYNKMQ